MYHSGNQITVESMGTTLFNEAQSTWSNGPQDNQYVARGKGVICKVFFVWCRYSKECSTTCPNKLDARARKGDLARISSEEAASSQSPITKIETGALTGLGGQLQYN